MAGSGDLHSMRMRMCVACPGVIPSRLWRLAREARAYLQHTGSHSAGGGRKEIGEHTAAGALSRDREVPVCRVRMRWTRWTRCEDPLTI